MSKTPEPKDTTPTTQPEAHNARTPMERTMDLARRLFAVPKSEIPTKRKLAKRKRRHD